MERRLRRRSDQSSRPVITIDVGSASTRVSAPGLPLVEEPSVVVVAGEEVLATGWEALRVSTRGSEVCEIVHPVFGGAPARKQLYIELVRQVGQRALVPKTPATVAISLPAALGPVEAGEVLSCIRSALPMADEVTVSAPAAASLGAGCRPVDGAARLVVDVGHHLVETAIVVDGATIAERSAWTGGAEAMSVLAGHLRQMHSVEANPRSPQRALRAASHPMYGNVAVRGVDRCSGEERVVLLRSNEVADELRPVFDKVDDNVRQVLAAVPTRLASAVLAEPVLLTGGMARVHGMRGQLTRFLGAGVEVLGAPAQTVAAGLRRAAYAESSAVQSTVPGLHIESVERRETARGGSRCAPVLT